jgi:hypothetical protein
VALSCDLSLANMGFYAQHLRRWLEFVDGKQILAVTYDELNVLKLPRAPQHFPAESRLEPASTRPRVIGKSLGIGQRTPDSSPVQSFRLASASSLWHTCWYWQVASGTWPVSGTLQLETKYVPFVVTSGSWLL